MPTETLRPNGTISASYKSLTGAASAHAATNDDSDSSYFTQGYLDSMTQLAFGTFTLPAGNRVVSVRGRVRKRRQGGSGSANAEWRLWTTTGNLAAPHSHASTSSSFHTVSGSWISTSLTQTQINGLAMNVASISTGGNDISFAELYIDVVHTTQPSVTATYPTGDPTITDTNQPTITWNYAQGDDGGAQTFYRVKVFTEAQVADGGFDPDTTEPIYDSGVVTGNATEQTVDPLVNEDYTVYVWAAQTINGVAHWSNPTSADFTVNVDTADVATVTAVAVDASARIDVTVDRDTGAEAWDYVEIQRSIDGGTTWEWVRGARYVTPDSADEHAVSDHEAPPGVQVHYRARATRILNDLPITGEWVQTSTPAEWTATAAWLKDPHHPAANRTVRIVAVTPDEHLARRGVHQPLGAAAPIVISDTRQRASASITLHAGDATTADAIAELLAEPALLLQAPPEWGEITHRYVSPLDVSRQRFNRHLRSSTRRIVIPYVEVDQPVVLEGGDA